jgi:alginate O-acetyltransferase complex protein AlgI
MSVLSLQWLLWMAITVALFWAAPVRFRHYVLLLLTATFLLLADSVSLLLLLTMGGVALLFCRKQHTTAPQLGISIVAIVSVLVYFKLGVTLQAGQADTSLLIPLGLSYYALRVIHLMLERHIGRFGILHTAELARYLFFLPTLQVGPIHRYQQFKRDTDRHRWLAEDMWRGLERIIFGYAKITVLGNFLISRQFFSYIAQFESTAPALYQYLDSVRYGANLYVQFSGYSDIAIGFALLLGYRVMENFNNPFLKQNISEFWRAWHISLTSWCREYVYTAVTAFSRQPALAAMATLLVIALWHEISWRYLLWGLYHGAGIIVWQLFHRYRPASWQAVSGWQSHTSVVVSTLLTLNFVIVGFALTKESTAADGIAALQTMLMSWRDR